MIPQIRYNEKYLKDLEKYKIGIEKISNEVSKSKAQSLLEELQNKMKLIDEIHSSSGFKNIKSNREQIEQSVKIRHQLEQLLK